MKKEKKKRKLHKMAVYITPAGPITFLSQVPLKPQGQLPTHAIPLLPLKQTCLFEQLDLGSQTPLCTAQLSALCPFFFLFFLRGEGGGGK